MRYAKAQDGGILICEYAEAPGQGFVAIGPKESDPPRPTPNHRRALVGGALVWVGRSEDQAWADVRAQRDALLAACDWITVRAVEQGQPVPTAWATYRQALRDIAGQADPFNVTWPAAPT